MELSETADDFDAEELREWSRDKRGSAFWMELRRMANIRMDGLRQAMYQGEDHKAKILAGELNMIEEVLQVVDILIDDQKERGNTPV